jgi:hypothetical protein
MLMAILWIGSSLLVQSIDENPNKQTLISFHYELTGTGTGTETKS